MTFSSGFRFQPRWTVAQKSYLFAILCVFGASHSVVLAQDQAALDSPTMERPVAQKPVAENPAQDNPAGEQVAESAAGDAIAEQAVKINYKSAVDLFPQNTAGFIRIPNVPNFRQAAQQIHIGRLLNDPVMEPFIEAQRVRVESYLESLTNEIVLRPQDFNGIVSGEVAMAWLPARDQHRPYSACVVADIRGRRAKAEVALNKIDVDLKAGGATRRDVLHQGEEIRVYQTKPKAGQLKVEQIAITFNDARIIASDRDTVVQDVLDAVAGMPKGQPLSSLDNFKSVMTQSNTALESIGDDGSTKSLEWYAEPLELARILRRVFEVDRGGLVDIVKLLESQGFTAVKAIGGVAALDGKRFDLLHRGYILAPGPFQKAAKILGFFNRPLDSIPDWVGKDTGSFSRFNWRVEQAFWASENLINEAMGDEIFRPIIDGIRDDEEGPQIDLAKDFFPNLDDQAIVLGDNTAPAAIDSERMLVAIRLKNAGAVKNVIRKAMAVEPDATEIKALPGVEIWRVQRGEGDDDLEEDLANLGFEDPDDVVDGEKPLLDHWAIAVVEAPNAGPSYLMFSSHPELLIESAKRIRTGQKGGFVQLQDIQTVVKALKDLGAEKNSYDHVSRMKMAMRAKYELLRKGLLKESDSVTATIFRRLVPEDEGGQPDPLSASKLPPLNQIEKYLPEGGAFFQATDKGWLMTGFYLK